MSTKINVLQVIPKLGYSGAETGCYDIAHYLSEKDCGSFIATSGGELLKFIKKEKVKIVRLPVHSKNPILVLFNALMLSLFIIFFIEFLASLDHLVIFPFINLPDDFPWPEYSTAR